MSSLENILSNNITYKRKICLLGGQEDIKNAFQRKVSYYSLSFQNKINLGVNFSKIEFSYEDNYLFEFYLWNIDCGKEKAFLRGTFYSGAENIIIFISENKVEQILKYYNEIKNRIPVLNLVFCIILKNKSIEDIKGAYLENSDFKKFLKEEEIDFSNISNLNQIFHQISAFFLYKLENKKNRDNLVINFVPLSILADKTKIIYSCSEYYESNYQNSYNHRINTKLLRDLLYKLDIKVPINDFDFFNIFNKNFGTFSIFLRNGNVYFLPLKCQKCKNKKCLRIKKKTNFICISASTQGWSNIKGIQQNDLLLLSKIITLKNATEKDLPKPVLDQINKISLCPKD